MGDVRRARLHSGACLGEHFAYCSVWPFDAGPRCRCVCDRRSRAPRTRSSAFGSRSFRLTLDVGQTVVATFRITNLTKRTLHGQWSFTWSTPASGIGAALAGPLRPGRLAGETLRQKVTAKTPKGSYLISASVSDGRGASHASARAVFPG